jgi:putative sterol carrier protein
MSLSITTAPNGADCEMTIDSNDFVKMLKGELRASSAFMSGNLKIKGDVGFAMKLEKLMTQLKSKL